MKKNYLFLLILSIAGAFISGLLVIDHYMPQISTSLLKCGTGVSSCSELSLLPYSEILGIPVASLGFFFYIWIFFSTILFWESGEGFREGFIYLLLPVASAGLVTDFFLGGLLIYLKIFCRFCVMTYFINIFLFVVALLWYLKAKKLSGGWFSTARTFVNESDAVPHMKFLTGAYLFFTTMLFLFVITFSLYLKEASSFSSSADSTEQERMNDFLNEFRSQKPEPVLFPETDFIVGDRSNPLEITVITDPFCSACYSFHSTSAKLTEKYGKSVFFRYYFYPLDSTCNSDVKNTVYKNSCQAVRVIAAYSAIIPFSEVLETYYSNFKQLENTFQRDEIDYAYIHELFGLKERVTFDRFMKELNTGADEKVRDCVSAAINNGVEATPTFFINGRKIEGSLPPELFGKIIEMELSRSE